MTQPRAFLSSLIATYRRAVRQLTLGIAVACGLGLGAQSASAQSAIVQTAPGPQELFVELHGTNTLGTKVALGLANAWAKQLKLPAVRVVPGADPDEYEAIAEGAENARRMRVKVQAKGHGFGLEPLLRGQTDFWMAARQVCQGKVGMSPGLAK